MIINDYAWPVAQNSSAALGNREHVRVGALRPADESGRRVSVTGVCEGLLSGRVSLPARAKDALLIT
jgi:hypothetical protein